MVYPRLLEVAQGMLGENSPDHTLGAEGLVHESYLKLAGSAEPFKPNDRNHFFCLSALLMRQVLVDHARAKGRDKRPPANRRVDMWAVELFAARHPNVDVLDLNDALEQLSKASPSCAELIQLHFFVGLDLKSAAEVLGLSRSAAAEDWSFAMTFLRSRLEPDSSVR